MPPHATYTPPDPTARTLLILLHSSFKHFLAPSTFHFNCFVNEFFHCQTKLCKNIQGVLLTLAEQQLLTSLLILHENLVQLENKKFKSFLGPIEAPCIYGVLKY